MKDIKAFSDIFAFIRHIWNNNSWSNKFFKWKYIFYMNDAELLNMWINTTNYL